MGTHPLVHRITEAVQLITDKLYEEAIPVLARLIAEADGLPTAFLQYHLAIAIDMEGSRPGEAVDAILCAIEQEPLNSFYEQSRDVMAQRLDARLQAALGDDRAELFEMLRRLERVSLGSSLQYAAWCIDADHLEAAKRLVFAALLVEPHNGFALRMQNIIADRCSKTWVNEMHASLGHGFVTPAGNVSN